MRKRTHLQLAMLTLAIGTALAVMAYRGGYSFVSNSLSHLGKIVTESGSNTLSHIIFAITFLTCGIIMMDFARGHRSFLLYTAAAGFLLMPIPCDRFFLLHCFAAGFLVGGLFIWNLRVFIQRWNHQRRADRTVGFLLAASLICVLPVLFYAVHHLAGSDLREELQTLALISIVVMTWMTDHWIHFGTSPFRFRERRIINNR